MKKQLCGLLAGALALLGASQASAAPIFTVDPTTIAGTGTIFNADAINGFSSSRIRHDVGDPVNVYKANGYAFFNGFALDSSPVTGGVSRVNVDYGLYAVFSQQFTCTGPLGPGVNCTVSSFSFEMWADPGNDNTYSQSTVALDPTVGVNGIQYKLASSNVLNAGIGGLDALGGAFQNLNFGWTLYDDPVNPDGYDFFTDPRPFYNAAFTAFNNTSQGIICDTANCVAANVVAINSETGILDFNGNAIPEPGSIALLGLGLMLLGTQRLRRN